MTTNVYLESNRPSSDGQFNICNINNANITNLSVVNLTGGNISFTGANFNNLNTNNFLFVNESGTNANISNFNFTTETGINSNIQNIISNNLTSTGISYNTISGNNAYENYLSILNITGINSSFINSDITNISASLISGTNIVATNVNTQFLQYSLATGTIFLNTGNINTNQLMATGANIFTLTGTNAFFTNLVVNNITDINQTGTNILCSILTGNFINATNKIVLSDGNGNTYGLLDNSFLSWTHGANNLALVKKSGGQGSISCTTGTNILFNVFGTGPFNSTTIGNNTPTTLFTIGYTGVISTPNATIDDGSGNSKYNNIICSNLQATNETGTNISCSSLTGNIIHATNKIVVSDGNGNTYGNLFNSFLSWDQGNNNIGLVSKFGVDGVIASTTGHNIAFQYWNTGPFSSANIGGGFGTNILTLGYTGLVYTPNQTLDDGSGNINTNSLYSNQNVSNSLAGLVLNSTNTTDMTNNSTIINNAVNAFKHILLPLGTIWVNNTIRINHSGLTLEGQGQQLTNINLYTGVNLDCILITGNGVTDVYLKNFSINCNGYTGGTAKIGNVSGNGINVWSAYNCLFENITVNDAGSNSFNIDNSSRCVYNNCSSYRPILSHHSQGSSAEDCVIFENFCQNAGAAGISLFGNGPKLLNSHSYWNNGPGVFLADFSNGAEIVGNIINRNGTHGLIVSGNSYSNITNNQFFNEGQLSAGFTGAGIALYAGGFTGSSPDESFGNTICNNTIYDNWNGVPSTDGFTGSNGIYYPNITAHMFQGIYCSNGQQNNIISNNVIDYKIANRYQILEPNNLILDFATGTFYNNLGSQFNNMNNVSLNNSNLGLVWNAVKNGSNFNTIYTGSNGDYSANLFLDSTGTFHIQNTSVATGIGNIISFQDVAKFDKSGIMNVSNENITNSNITNLTGTNANITNINTTNITGTTLNLSNATITNINTTNITGQSLQLFQQGTDRTFNSNQFYQNPGGSIVLGGTATLTGSTNNLAIGSALTSLSTANVNNSNVSVGNLSLRNLITGTNNVAIGFGAGANISQGNENIFVGRSVGGIAGSWSNDNICIGDSAGSNMSGINIANNNTFLGYRCGINSSTGSLNTFVGAFSGNLLGVQPQNSIAIGSNSVVSQSNIAVIGDNNITNILPGTGSTCDLGINYQPFNNIFTKGTILTPVLNITGSTSLSNIQDNSYFASPSSLPLVNNSYTGVMTYNFNAGSTTVLASNFKIRLQSTTGTSVQSYSNFVNLLCQNTGSGNPSYIFTLPFSQTLSVPAGSLSVNITGNATSNSLQILVKPSVSTSPATISCDFNGDIQCGNQTISSITFP